MSVGSGDKPSYDEFLGKTFGQMMDFLASEIPEKEALVFEDKRLSYSELRDNIRRVAMALKKIGVQKGDRVGVLFQNCPEFFYVQQAILYIGGIFISLSTRYRKFEITYMMKHADAKFMFCVDKYKGTNFINLLEGIRSELPEMKTIIIKGQDIPVWAKSYKDVTELGEKIDEKLLSADLPEVNDICSILYTSGSTGTPKGVMHTHNSLMWDSTRVCERLRIEPEDVFLMMLPCSHIFASFVLYTNAMMGRSKIVIMETFDAGEALRLQEAERVSVLYGVPAMFTLMLNHADFKKFDLTANRTGYMSGASCSVDLVRAVMQKMHCKISAAYGMSEACCNTVTNFEDDEHIKSKTAGRPIRGLDIKIVGDNRMSVDAGMPGEIAIRGKNLFTGYYKQEDLTQSSFDSDSFFYTGDLGKLDKNGRLIMVGRKKEMIIRGGFNVYPAEVEEIIASFEGVQYAVVTGVPDKILGEKICACVVPKPGYRLQADAIIQFCKENQANFKVPDFVEIMESFPMTTTEKIQKFKIKALMEKKHGDAS